MQNIPVVFTTSLCTNIRMAGLFFLQLQPVTLHLFMISVNLWKARRISWPVAFQILMSLPGLQVHPWVTMIFMWDIIPTASRIVFMAAVPADISFSMYLIPRHRNSWLQSATYRALFGDTP